MFIHALAHERQVEIRDVNFPQVQFLCHQVSSLHRQLADSKKLSVELMRTIRSNENEVLFLEHLTQRFCHRVHCLNETVAALQHGGGSDSTGSNA